MSGPPTRGPENENPRHHCRGFSVGPCSTLSLAFCFDKTTRNPSPLLSFKCHQDRRARVARAARRTLFASASSLDQRVRNMSFH